MTSEESENLANLLCELYSYVDQQRAIIERDLGNAEGWAWADEERRLMEEMLKVLNTLHL